MNIINSLPSEREGDLLSLVAGNPEVMACLLLGRKTLEMLVAVLAAALLLLVAKGELYRPLSLSNKLCVI